MPFRKVCIGLIILCGLPDAFAQKKYELLGNPNAIVLDLGIDEEKNYLVASTTTEIQLWNYKSKSLVRTWATPSIHCIELYKNLCAGVSTSGELFIWDIESAKELRYGISHSPLVTLTWIDSTRIAIGDEEGTLYKVNSMTGEIEIRIKLNASVTALSRGTNNTLLVGKREQGIEIYDAMTFKPIKSIDQIKGSVSLIHFTDSAKYFVTVSDQYTLTKWRVPDLYKYGMKYGGAWITSVDFVDLKDGSMVAVGKLNGNIIVNIGFGKYSGKANAIVNRIVLLENEKPAIKMAVATHGGGIQLWDAIRMKVKTN